MFYNTLPFKKGGEKEEQSEKVSAVIVLTPSESKRIIAKAVARLPEIRQAMQKGAIVARLGSTGGFVMEELLGISISKSDFVSGSINGGELTGSMSPTKIPPFVIRNGKKMDMTGMDAVDDFGPGDVLIKGANAVDREGNAGVFVATEIGIGPALSMSCVRGFHLIVPVGLDKMVPSVLEAAKVVPGIYHLKYCTGMPVSLLPLIAAKVITEIQAFEILCGIDATHIGSGGIGGSEGSVVLCLTGSEKKLEEAMQLIKSIKGEPPVAKPSKVNPPSADFGYSVAQFHEKLWPLILPGIKR